MSSIHTQQSRTKAYTDLKRPSVQVRGGRVALGLDVVDPLVLQGHHMPGAAEPHGYDIVTAQG